MISVDTSDAVSALDALISGLEDAVDDGLLEIAKAGKAEALRRVPKRTGRLARSIHIEPYALVADAPYAIFVEEGSRGVMSRLKGLFARLRGRTTRTPRAQPFMRYAGEKMSTMDGVIERHISRLLP